jgi:hypothetical protein
VSEKATKYVDLQGDVEISYFERRESDGFRAAFDLDQKELVMTHQEVWDVFKEMTGVFALHDKSAREHPWSVQDAVDELLFRIAGLLEEKVNASDED